MTILFGPGLKSQKLAINTNIVHEIGLTMYTEFAFYALNSGFDRSLDHFTFPSFKLFMLVPKRRPTFIKDRN